MMAILKQFCADRLQIEIHDTRDHMGRAAAKAAADAIRSLLSNQETINMIFAAAPSQNETLACLILEEGIDWSRINAFHMDEYIGLPANAPQAFGTYLYDHIFSKLPFRSVSYLDASATDAEAECSRYSKLLAENPVDIVCLGIGEKGHIAFNDPWVADFEDTALVKPVPLDPVCRQQQVNDGCFDRLEQVPTHAITLTIPVLAAAKHMICTVPASTKAWAVEKTISAPISSEIPATVMRNHPHAILFCDAYSGANLIK